MSSEVSTDLIKIGTPVKSDFERFAADTGRKLHLEIEPGTFLVANAGALVSTVQDIISTGKDGHCFIKVRSLWLREWHAHTSQQSLKALAWFSLVVSSMQA